MQPTELQENNYGKVSKSRTKEDKSTTTVTSLEMGENAQRSDAFQLASDFWDTDILKTKKLSIINNCALIKP